MIMMIMIMIIVMIASTILILTLILLLLLLIIIIMILLLIIIHKLTIIIRSFIISTEPAYDGEEHRLVFEQIELVSVAIFSVEYLLRFWS